MPRRVVDDVAPRPGGSGTRTFALAGGFVLAAAATLAVFLTDNPRYLRLAVVAVAWAFVLATFAAGRRATDRVAAAARETELRRAYERQLAREAAARHEHERESDLRRETEGTVRNELDGLRKDIAALSGLRDEVARVSALRGDIEALTALREDVARVAALRDDVAALNALRQDLGQLAEVRADMTRLRTELTEQLSSEMLVERIVMRTQASRLPADHGSHDPGRTLEGSWVDDVPPRELTGGWPAVHLDEAAQTQQVEQVRVQRAGFRPPVPARRPTPYRRSAGEDRPAAESRPWEASRPVPAEGMPPPTTSWPAVLSPAPEPDRRPAPEPPLWSSLTRHEDPAPESRHAAREPAPEAPPTTGFPLAAPPSAPLEWLAARSLIDPPTPPSASEVSPRRRRGEEAAAAPVDPAAAPTTQRPAVPPAKPVVRIDDRGGYRVAVREEPAPQPEPTEHGTRLAEILAENGVSPATGGRRRRRYREDDEADDVLARILRGN